LTQVDNYLGNGKSAPPNRSTVGPLDSSEFSANIPMVDFGSILVPDRPDIAKRVEFDDAGQIVALTLELNYSTLQLQAFAAPRNEGLWHEVRNQLKASVSAQGGDAQFTVGAFGPELLAHLPVLDNQGQKVATRTDRFIGLDGPRWFLKGIVRGAAVRDSLSAADLDDLFRSLVVVRGETPLPPGDMLPLVVPAGAIPAGFRSIL
jgi:hypothetical protein